MNIEKSDNMKINIFDFDKTIYDGDSSIDFFFYSLSKRPYILINLPRMFSSWLLYILKIISKTKMKENIFAYLKYLNNTNDMVNSFWNKNKYKIKDFYLNRDHTNDVIISASPYFLLDGICKELNVKKLIASDVDIKTGKFNGLNCHDIEKVSRLNKIYKNYEVMESYSDSLSDLPILKLAKKAYLVKKDKIKIYKF